MTTGTTTLRRVAPPENGTVRPNIVWRAAMWACADIPFTLILSLHRGMHRDASGNASGVCLGGPHRGVCIGIA